MKISVTTVMLPHLDLRQTCELLKRLGYDGMELRVRRFPAERANEAPSPWGRHLTDLSPDNILQRADEVRSMAKEYGLEIPAFATACDASDLEQVRLLAEGAKGVGCPAIRVGCRRYDGTVNYNVLYDEAVRNYSKSLEITREYGIKTLVETHTGTIHLSASLAHRLVSNFDPKDIGVIYDPQNMVSDGFENTQLALELLGDYLAHIHAGGHKPVPNKPNEKGIVTWSWPGCPMAEGLYDYQTLINCLRKMDYKGFISVEDFRSDVPAEQRLEEGIKFLRRL